MRRIFSILMLLGFGLLLTACNPTYTYRYRLALELEADGRVYAGSSVIEVSQYLTPAWFLMPSSLSDAMIGEAAAIDLGDGRYLVALLEGVSEAISLAENRKMEWHGPNPTILLMSLYGLSYDWKDGRNKGLDQLLHQRGVKELQVHQLPTLVTFTDVNDPKSLVVVDPRNMPATMGSGVRLKRATIEITDAPLTVGLGNKLPWLATVRGYLSGERVCTVPPGADRMPFCPDRSHFARKGI